MQPATAQITNPTNMAKDQFGCLFFFFFHFWMQTLWFRIYSLHQSRGTDSGCIKCYCMIQTTHFWQCMKGYCFFVLPLLHCLSFCVYFFFVMPGLVSNRNKTTWGSGARGWHRTALHCSTWCSWDYSLELVYSPIKEGDTVAVFVLQDWEKNKRQQAIRGRPFIQKATQGKELLF